jgi:large subunit ribosomal protein L28
MYRHYYICIRDLKGLPKIFPDGRMLFTMAKVCAVTKKSSLMVGGYSNRTRATQFNPIGTKRKYANLQTKKIFIPELNKSVRVTLSARGIKTVQKNGPFATLKKAGLI